MMERIMVSIIFENILPIIVLKKASNKQSAHSLILIFALILVQECESGSNN